MHRRQFLRGGASAAAAVTLGPSFWQAARAGTASEGPYGSLDGRAPDANGLVLPEGFTSQALGITGTTVEGTDYLWHPAPDGGATFATDDGGWIYVSNSEFPAVGGVGALRFNDVGTVVDAYPILENTTQNCAGGPTPWGTWLSCEEFDAYDDPAFSALAPTIAGQVWECDPTGVEPAHPLPAMGLFQHEAAAVDPEGEAVYLTEDKPDGLLYRFTPDTYPDLSDGLLEAAVVTGDQLSWLTVPDPSAADGPTRHQVPDATPFDGGEGIWFADGVLYFTTKGDGAVRAIHVADQRLETVYDPADTPDGPLRGVDNITVAEGSGDIYVAEDGDNMELVIITPEREVAPFARIEGHEGSEITGPAFSPDGRRVYFSSQRGPDNEGVGITYEVTGPFRQGESSAPTTTLAQAAGEADAAATPDGGDGSDGLPLALGAVGVAAAAAAGGLVALRSRRNR